MWTKKKINDAAKEYISGYHLKIAEYNRLCMSDLMDAFIEGCNYILKNTQKEEVK